MYYSGQRTKNLFNPNAKEPFRLSRTKLELFLKCPRCFYLDRRLGVGQPPGFPFSLNSAVDHLLKKEFDLHRAKNSTHPLMKAYGLKAVPYSHPDIEKWRENFVGISFLHKPTNFEIFGAVDDVWIGEDGKLIVVDYKSTSKDTEVNIDADWQKAYKNQMEIYQWLFRQNGFEVNDTGYFVYANGRRDREAFDGRLEFTVKIIGYPGNTDWIEEKIISARKCLDNDQLPKSSENCEFCLYRQSAAMVEK